jgi:hypothetical protein
MAAISEAILRFRAGWVAEGVVSPSHHNSFRWDRIGDPKQYVERISPTRLGGQPRKVIGTKLSEQDAEHVAFLASAIGVNQRQVIEGAVMIFLSSKGVPVNGLHSTTLDEFWAPHGDYGQGRALLCLLEKGRGEDWKLWGQRGGRPLEFKDHTILLDASVLLLCLGQEEKAQRVIRLLFKSAARIVITSAIISEVSLKGSAILSATEDFSVENRLQKFKGEQIFTESVNRLHGLHKRIGALIACIASVNIEPSDYPIALCKAHFSHFNLTRFVSLTAVHRVRKQQAITVLRAVRVSRNGPGDQEIEFCFKIFRMPDGEFWNLTGAYW